MEQNRHVQRLIKSIKAEGFPKSTSFNNFIRFLIRRLRLLNGVSVVYLVLKLRKLDLHERSGYLVSFSRNLGALNYLASLYPLTHTIGLDSKGSLSQNFALWNLALIPTVSGLSSVPDWVSSYVLVEAISDYINSLSIVKLYLSHLDSKYLNRLKQALFSLIIPLLHIRISTSQDKKLSGGSKFLFGHRNYKQDFLLFFGIWNFLSLYNSVKSLIQKSDDNSNSLQYIKSKTMLNSNFKFDKTLFSTGFKPLVDKFNERQEVRTTVPFSIVEWTMNSNLVQNIVPCVKWTIWRQLLLQLFHERHNNNFINLNKCTNLMKSLILMLTFVILDNGKPNMNVRPGVIKYFIRSILSNKINEFSTDPRLNKLTLLASAQLANYNHSKFTSSEKFN